MMLYIQSIIQYFNTDHKCYEQCYAHYQMSMTVHPQYIEFIASFLMML